MVVLPEDADPGTYKKVIFRYYQENGQGEKTYLSFLDGVKLTSRQVEFKKLSVLQIQNGWAGLYLERNQSLSGTNPPIATAEEFIYTTPVRRFSNPVTPSVKVSADLPIGSSASGTKLIDYLTDLLSKLMSTPNGSITPVKLKILTRYKYQSVAEIIQLPVGLMPPKVFDDTDVKGTGPAIKGLNKQIRNWFNTNTPSLNVGLLDFEITFYSSLKEDSTLPLLTLQNVTLPVAKVSDISGS